MLKKVFALVLFAASIAHGQIKTTIDCSWKSPYLESPGKFKKGTPCREVWVNGVSIILAETQTVRVGSQPSTGLGALTYGYIVAVMNKGSDDIDLGIDAMSMDWNNGQSSPAVDPDATIDNHERKQNVINFWSTVLDQAATGDNNAVAVDSSDGHSVAYATSLAQENGNTRAGEIASSASSLRSEALRRNTIKPGAYAVGTVYFTKTKTKGYKTVYPDTMRIIVGDTAFLF